jgi:hypothetical protein
MVQLSSQSHKLNAMISLVKGRAKVQIYSMTSYFSNVYALKIITGRCFQMLTNCVVFCG